MLVPFPFSNLSRSKYRPALVMSNDIYNGKFLDFIAIPITSNPNTRDHTVLIEMSAGSLPFRSVAKVDKIFSLEQSLVVRTFGQVRQDIFYNIRSELLNLISWTWADHFASRRGIREADLVHFPTFAYGFS